MSRFHVFTPDQDDAYRYWARLGFEPFPDFGHVLDAEGRCLSPLIAADLETGRAWRYHQTRNSLGVTWTIVGTRPLVILATYPAPLTFVAGPPVGRVYAPFPDDWELVPAVAVGSTSFRADTRKAEVIARQLKGGSDGV